MTWHTGRTFYACLCGARDERLDAEPPRVLDCWQCKAPGSMSQWVPPAVARARVLERG